MHHIFRRYYHCHRGGTVETSANYQLSHVKYAGAQTNTNKGIPSRVVCLPNPKGCLLFSAAFFFGQDTITASNGDFANLNAQNRSVDGMHATSRGLKLNLGKSYCSLQKHRQLQAGVLDEQLRGQDRTCARTVHNKSPSHCSWPQEYRNTLRMC